MGVRSWLGNILFNIDERIDKKVGERMIKYDTRYDNQLLLYRQKENAVWASGSADKILYFYSLHDKPSTFSSNRLEFWRWVSNADINVPKLHYPASTALLNSIKSLMFGENPSIEFVSEDDKNKAKVNKLNERIWAIMEDNNENSLYQNAASLESYSGGVAFKINIDKEVSDYPIIELYPQERIQLKTRYGRLVEIVFLDEFKKENKTFRLKSIHGLGYIDYELYNEKGVKTDLGSLDETKDLKRLEFKHKILMAVYKKNRTDNVEVDSAYGGSDFDGIIDLFHQIDEIFSSMALYIRRSRPILSIQERMLPVTKDGSKQYTPKEFEYDLTVLNNSESADNISSKIYRDVPELDLSPYLDSIKSLQKAVYQKVGMDTTSTNLDEVGANQSGEALIQREKSTVILYQNKVQGWQHTLRELVRLLLIFEDISNNSTVVEDYKDYSLNVGFADYQSASLSERIEMFSNAYKNMAIDLDTMVDKVWNEELEQEQIDKMATNIRVENGIPFLVRDENPVIADNEDDVRE